MPLERTLIVKLAAPWRAKGSCRSDIRISGGYLRLPAPVADGERKSAIVGWNQDMAGTFCASKRISAGEVYENSEFNDLVPDHPRRPELGHNGFDELQYTVLAVRQLHARNLRAHRPRRALPDRAILAGGRRG